MSIYAERLAKVRKQMAEHEVSLLVLTPSPYMYYASGVQDKPYFGILKGPGDWLNSLWISLDGDPLLLVHWMVHRMLVRKPGGLIQINADVRVVEPNDDPLSVLKEAIQRFNPVGGKIAVADRSWAYFSERLRTAFDDEIEIRMASEVMDSLLAIKDEEALRLLRRACAITDDMYGEVLRFVRPGVTERDVALEIEYQFRKQGADGVSFPASVVFGRAEDEKGESPGVSAREIRLCLT